MILFLFRLLFNDSYVKCNVKCKIPVKIGPTISELSQKKQTDKNFKNYYFGLCIVYVIIYTYLCSKKLF